MIAIESTVRACLNGRQSWGAAPSVIQQEFINTLAFGQSCSVEEVHTAWYYFDAGHVAACAAREAAQPDPEAHARAILDAKTDDWFWIEAGEQVAHLDGMFTLDQVEAIATLMRLGKGYRAKWV